MFIKNLSLSDNPGILYITFAYRGIKNSWIIYTKNQNQYIKKSIEKAESLQYFSNSFVRFLRAYPKEYFQVFSLFSDFSASIVYDYYLEHIKTDEFEEDIGKIQLETWPAIKKSEVTIDGVVYESKKEAASKLGIEYNKFLRMIKTEKICVC